VNARRPRSVSRLSVALNDSAGALSGELPTADIDCRTPVAAHAAAEALEVIGPAVVGVQYRAVEAASGALGGVQRVEDEFGAHVPGGEERTAIRAVFSWSYIDLPPAAARVFCLLGVSPGPDSTSRPLAICSAPTWRRPNGSSRS
jgi:hypothetical protein